MEKAFSFEIVTSFNPLSGYPTQLSIKPLSDVKDLQEAVSSTLNKLENRDLTAARITIERFDRPTGILIS